jgi:beta-xylosidase
MTIDTINTTEMRKQVPVLVILSIAALCLLLTEIAFAGNAKEDGTYSNPVLVKTFNMRRLNPDRYIGTLGIGDPTVIFHDGKYYLYPTGDNYSYDVYISSDLINWKQGPKVFRSDEHGVWAPDVFYNPADRKFYLYYTANRKIGVAVAERPDGTFVDQGVLIENAIDAHMFLDGDGKYYLPVRIIKPTEPWEMKHIPLTEAPWMLKHKGIYYLLYSGGSADSQHYAIGYATAKRPVGPFTKYTGNPIVKNGNGILGPGHLSVTKDFEGKLWMVYHQQKNESRGWNRIIGIDRLWFDDKGVLHGKATRGITQPAPATRKP